MPRWAAKVDRNHAHIRDGLRECGYYVIDTGRVGNSFPDLLVVSKAGRIVLLEIKNPGEYPTEGQARFLTHFPGPASVVFGLQDALDVMVRHD